MSVVEAPDQVVDLDAKQLPARFDGADIAHEIVVPEIACVIAALDAPRLVGPLLHRAADGLDRIAEPPTTGTHPQLLRFSFLFFFLMV